MRVYNEGRGRKEVEGNLHGTQALPCKDRTNGGPGVYGKFDKWETFDRMELTKARKVYKNIKIK